MSEMWLVFSVFSFLLILLILWLVIYDFWQRFQYANQSKVRRLVYAFVEPECVNLYLQLHDPETRVQPTIKEKVSLVDSVSRVIQNLQTMIETHNVRIVLTTNGKLPAICSQPEKLEAALTLLLFKSLVPVIIEGGRKSELRIGLNAHDKGLQLALSNSLNHRNQKSNEPSPIKQYINAAIKWFESDSSVKVEQLGGNLTLKFQPINP